ncbi:MAG: ThiF family adenylyltransferase [Blastocatellia bacterium]|nr:ThiF family adenylyltransferase [Blastocatellia bacterium]
MNAFLLHERLYRQDAVLEKIRTLPVTICGCGALGANLVESLARSGFGKLKVIDFDRIEERNLSTQPFYKSDIGGFKAKICSNAIYRAVGVQVEAVTERLTEANALKLLKGSGVVVDAFDNSGSRKIVTETCLRETLPCLHAGMADGYAEVIWNESYRVPSDANDDVCDYPLARNLVLLTVAVTCETLIQFAATGARNSFTCTLKDLAIQPFA